MRTVNPATGRIIKSYPEFSAGKVGRICAGAQRAFEHWRCFSFARRGARMKKAAKILIANKERYARLMALEMGKPLAQGRSEIEKCAWVCTFYAREARRYLAPEPIKTQARKSFVRFEPLGIVLAVMPWNFPFWQVFRAAVPALMAGNGMVLKHASNVCGCSLAVEEIFRKAGFPGGIFCSLLIPGSRVNEVIEHPAVRAVTLTGSTAAGKSIAAAAGAVLKKTVLELGGSDPYVVLEDAPLAEAVEACVSSRLINSGQSCIAAKRFIVVESLFEDFTARVVEKMRSRKVGDPLEEGVSVGPLARRDLRDQLHGQVQKSVRLGARLLLGGRIPAGRLGPQGDNPGLGRGAFYPPTVLVNVRPGMPAYEEELFGPVAVVLKARDEREALASANDTVFGLGAAVFTRNRKRAQRLVGELQAGCCFVNDFVRSDPRLPFGGIKESGYGRELSGFGIREFVNIKTVYIK